MALIFDITFNEADTEATFVNDAPYDDFTDGGTGARTNGSGSLFSDGNKWAAAPEISEYYTALANKQYTYEVKGRWSGTQLQTAGCIFNSKQQNTNGTNLTL